MRNVVSAYAEKFRHERKAQVRLAVVLLLLAFAVAGLVFWQLRYTGVAMANETSCGLEEHQHTEDCYAQVLTCGLTESEESGHVHTEDCWTKTLTCDRSEHEHTALCLSDGTADTETTADWEATLPEELTGVWADDVVAVAESQLGYAESEQNFTLAEDGVTRQGYTRYGAWYGNAYGDWDAMFVSFCLHYAGVDEEVFPQASGVYAWLAELEKPEPEDETGEAWRYADAADYEPLPGDLVFFDTDGDGEADHMGIVTAPEVEANEESEEATIISLRVIEGDCDDAVRENVYAPDDEAIVGYGILPENPDADEEEVESEEAGEITLACEGENYSVSVTYGPEAELPEDAELRVFEYDENSEVYQDRCAEIEPEEDSGARLFNIGLYVCEAGENGEDVYTEVEPAVPVRVTITYPSGEDTESGGYTIAHFGEETEVITPEVSTDGEETTITFRLDSFSDIMVMANRTMTVVLDLGNVMNYNTTAENWFYNYNYTNRYNYTLRYAVTVNSGNSGSVTVNLPADSDLPTNGGTATWALAGDQTVTLRNATEYDYKLVGWYDIYTGEYYDVSEGSQTITLEDTTTDHVFYADWIAASYNHGSTTDSGYDNSAVSTADFVTIEMYDYNELFNLYSCEVTPSSSGTDPTEDGVAQNSSSNSIGWIDTGKFYSTPFAVNDSERSAVDGTSSFVFFDNGAVYSKGALGDANDRKAWNGSSSNDAARWGIASPTGNIYSDYIFNDKALGVHYVGTADYLFQYGDDKEDANTYGYYYYDSASNFASYNQSDARFYLYNNVKDVGGSDGILPYNNYSDTIAKDNGSVNYWFGMSMEIDFYLPDEVGSNDGNNNNKLYNQDLTFHFSGDDDILIFVDDILVLDMSGIHAALHGQIDFATGVVQEGEGTSEGEVSWSNVYVDGFNGGAGGTGTYLQAGAHTLTVYYLERGGNQSNMSVSFNISPVWEYETGPLQTIFAQKQWSVLNGGEVNGKDTANFPDVNFGLFEAMEYVILADGSYQVSESHVYNTTDYKNEIYTINTSDTSTDEDGKTYCYSRDDEGLIDAYLTKDEEGNDVLYVRVDTHTLKYEDEGETYWNPETGKRVNSYGWYYTWELLEPEGDYIVLELSENASFTMASDMNPPNEGAFYYWTIIGEAEMEGYLT